MGTNALPPNLQSALQTLFELFAAYVAASTTREREELHAEIIENDDLFISASDHLVEKLYKEHRMIVFLKLANSPRSRSNVRNGSVNSNRIEARISENDLLQ